MEDFGMHNGQESMRADVAANIPQYINLIKEDLLPKLMKEDDPQLRKSLGRTISSRLHQVNSMVRPRVLATEQTRRDILSVVSPSSRVEKFRGNLLHEKGPDKFLQHEKGMDDKIVKYVKRCVRELETDKQDLEEALSRRTAIRKDVEKPPSSKASKLCTNGNMSSEKLERLEALVKKQDEEITVLQRQLAEEHTKYVHVLKSEYNDVIDDITPFVKQFGELTGLSGISSETEKAKKISSAYSLSESLKTNICTLLKQIEKMKDRVDQTVDELKHMEKEKEVCLKLLDNDYDDADENTMLKVNLTDVLADKLDEWEGGRKDLQEEIKSLRKNMEILAERNRQLMIDFDKATREPVKSEPSKAAASPRVRRSSAPTKTGKPKAVELAQHKESRERKPSSPAAVVGIAPRLISFGDSPGSPSIGRARPRVSTSGPMKATH